MKNKPVYEYTDKRASERYKLDQAKRLRARQLAERLMGKNYFTNTQEIFLKAVIEKQNETSLF